MCSGISFSAFGRKQKYDLISDLLGLHSIDNGVECRWNNYIEVSKHDVESAGNIMSKAMGKDGEKCRCIKHEDDTHMGTTGAKCLLAGISGREAKNSTENEDVRNSNENDIRDDCHDGNTKAIPDVDGNISTGKPGNTYMFTVCVGYDACPTERQAGEQEHIWQDDAEASKRDAHSNLDDGLWGQDSVVSQGRTNGHIAIKCHGHQDG